MKLKKSIKNIENYVIEQRRYFHQNPELPWHEYKTSERIQNELKTMGIPYKVVEKTGVIATIKGEYSGKSLGIRADIDALPIQEQTDLDFKSKNDGVMHACGHDAHTAILLGTAKVLNEMKKEIYGEIQLVFQPAEEYIQDSGAKYISQIESVKNLDRIIALHIWGEMDVGQAALKVGPVMASADTFDIYVEGKSGHGAMPHASIDPIVAGSQLVGALQTVVSRENDPLEPQVISVTAFNSGSSKNSIPEVAHLEGTVRFFNNELRDGVENQIKRIIDGVSLLSRTKIELDFHKGTPSTINELKSTQMGIGIAREIFEEGFIDNYPKQMGGEDFAKYLINTPGCYLMLGGAGKAGKFSHHNENFEIDESSFVLGIEYFVKYALKYLRSNDNS